MSQETTLILLKPDCVAKGLNGEVLKRFEAEGFRILGLDSDAPEDISAVDRSPPVAIVLGAEGKGLRQLTRDSCDHLVRLDMNGPIRSLNVSNACAVTLYALTR